MPQWKKYVLLGIAVGFGAGIGFYASSQAWRWYRTRPVPPAPWSTSAITATFDGVETTGAANKLAFSYILSNTTNEDYDHSAMIGNEILPKLVRADIPTQGSLIKIVGLGILIPAHQKVRYRFFMDLPYRESIDSTASPRQRQALGAWLRETIGLHGFVLRDTVKRYEIHFPAGW